jgi:Uma2 family endonuclease
MPATTTKISYQEFLANGPETLAEWVDGEVVLLGAPSRLHQNLVIFLGALFQFFVDVHRCGKVLTAPFQMKLGGSGREPDLLFVATEHLHRFRDNYLDGPADLAIEVVSPDSSARDRGEKFYEYEQAGVREYWLLDPVRRQAEFYQWSASGAYATLPVDENGIFRSRVIEGLWINVQWLWQDPLPPLPQVLKELGLL